MSIKLQNDVHALEAKIADLEARLSSLAESFDIVKMSVEELERLLQAMSRAPVGKGRAA